MEAAEVDVALAAELVEDTRHRLATRAHHVRQVLMRDAGDLLPIVSGQLQQEGAWEADALLTNTI